MEQLWIIVAEVLVEPGDLPCGLTKAFTNAVTWADSVEAACEKLSCYLESFKWQLLGLEMAHPISQSEQYREEVEDMIERAENNKKAIILGTFYTYKTN
jgi:hypothetical protein